jgi:hypothetical protein
MAQARILEDRRTARSEPEIASEEFNRVIAPGARLAASLLIQVTAPADLSATL